MYGWQRAFQGLIVAVVLTASTSAMAAGCATCLGVGYGPGYNANCAPGCRPMMARGCSELPPSWTYHVWRGYECEKPAWTFYGRPRVNPCCN
jgi:hypothetical protein